MTYSLIGKRTALQNFDQTPKKMFKSETKRSSKDPFLDAAEKNRLEETITALSKKILIDPQNPELTSKLALAFEQKAENCRQMGLNAESKTYFLKSLELKQSAFSLSRLAFIILKQGVIDEGKELLRKSFILDPKDPFTKNLVMMYLLPKKTETTENKDLADVYFHKGKSFYQKNLYTKAKEAFLEATKNCTNHKLSLYHLAKIYYEENHLKEVDTYLEKLKQLNAPCYKTFLLQAKLDFQKHQYEKSILTINQSLELYFENVKAFYLRALCYYSLKNYEQALQDFDKTLSYLMQEECKFKQNADTFATCMSHAAVCRFVLNGYKQPEEFLKALQESLEYDQENPFTLMWIGFISATIGKTKLSAQCYKKYLKYEPKDILALEKLGVYYYFKKKIKNAIDCFNSVLETNPNHLTTLAYRGEIYYKLEKWKEAEKDFKKLFYLSPSEKTLTYLCSIYCTLKKTQVYEQVLTKAFNTKSISLQFLSTAYNSLYQIYLNQNNVKKALQMTYRISFINKKIDTLSQSNDTQD